MWERLTKPWNACFEEAWEAYRNGSIPIGAVLTNTYGEIVSRGRNRINEKTSPRNQVSSNRLAHAEINVLLQVNSIDSDDIKGYSLYSTTEPCVQCFGAIVMSGVRRVRYAATDPVAGGANLNNSENSFIKSRNIDIQKDDKYIGEIQRVLRTDHVLRTMRKDQAEQFLNYYSVEYPQAIQLGRKWFHERKLQKAIEYELPIAIIVNEIESEIRAFY